MSIAESSNAATNSGAIEIAIAVEKISKCYHGNKNKSLDEMSFTVRKGETIGIIGPNGAGKTTLIMCLLGLHRPDTGNIDIFGLKPGDVKLNSLIGYMPERLNFEPWLSGREFISYHCELARIPKHEVADETRNRLRSAGLAEGSWDRQIRTFSRGMLQRVGIAQALINNPLLLLLDEPTSGIDPVGAMEILETIHYNRTEGKTILINSHQLDHLERICDRVIFVQDGKVAGEDALREENNKTYRLIVRWLQTESNVNRLEQIAITAGAKLLSRSDNQAMFLVSGDRGASVLLKSLADSNIPVCSAQAEQRLESFFRNEEITN